MKKILITLPFLLIPVFYFLSSFKNKPGITELTEKIISMMEIYVDEIPEEKVFVHLDKSLYASGDNIWFSVYLTAGSPDIPSPLSKVVYVDLLDNEGNLIQQKTIKIENGHGFGDFRLDGFTKEGDYRIKAYSYWLRGFGDEAVFETDIQILDPYNMKFQPTVTIEKEEIGNLVKYSAKITALDNTLSALAGKELSFQVANREQQLKSGIIQLDAQGKSELSFEIPSEKMNLPTALSLVLEENEEYEISRKFLLPFPMTSLDVQFLPEGGDLISDFNNKVAVRAIFPDGSPAKVTGKIKNDSEEISFQTNSSGLAAFNITPQSREKIEVQLETETGKMNLHLPEVKDQGINLAVNSSQGNLVNILIQSKAFQNISPSGEALMVVHARGRIGHMQVINLQQGVSGARINKSQLAPGINQITIFEPEGTPLAERMVFIPFESELKLKLEANAVNTKPREKNTWTLTMDGENFEGGIYSAAIVDANESPFQSSSSINSYLKLESELRGKIHNPKKLLGENRDDEGIDLIMLTHGWKRFDWEKVLEGNFENQNFIEQGINITGSVSPSSGRRGLSGGMLNVFSKGKSEDFISVEFNESGKFIIDELDFQDTTLLTISANDKRHKEYVKLELDPPLAKYAQWEGFRTIIQDFQISETARKFLESADKRFRAQAAFGEIQDITIDEFVIQADKYEPTEEEINRMYGKGDASLKPEEIGGFEGYRDIWELLQGRIPGVRIIPDLMGNPTIRIRGVGSIQAGGDPLILLDNVPVDVSFASSISPRDLASVEVFKDAASLAIFGAGGGSGAIALYTKRAAGIGETGEGVFNLRFPGYSVASEYYMPKYDQEKSAAPDYRSTLYWNPKLEWTGNTAKLEFFNNDIVQSYKVVVQGMDKFGRLSYMEKDL
jgi:hypothetical protein